MVEISKSYSLQIWFNDAPERVLLGTVSLYAHTSAEALRLLQDSLEYKVSEVEDFPWEVYEPVASYS